MLDRPDPPRGEATAVANTFDIVNNWAVWVAREQKVTMKRVDRACFIDGARGCDQGLAKNLAPVDA